MPFPAKTSREEIVAAARAMLDEQGWDEVSMRGLAARLSLTPNALYRYFAERDELGAALADAGARELLEKLESAGRGAREAQSALRILARVYLRFAREQPELYTVLMNRHAGRSETHAGHGLLWRFVVSQIARATGEARASEAAVGLWAYLHGVAELERAGLVTGQKPAAGFQAGLESLLAGLPRRRTTLAKRSPARRITLKGA